MRISKTELLQQNQAAEAAFKSEKIAVLKALLLEAIDRYNYSRDLREAVAGLVPSHEADAILVDCSRAMADIQELRGAIEALTTNE